MTLDRRDFLAGASGVVAGALSGTHALAQAAWPTRTVTVVNPHAPGAGVDPVARLLAQKLQERLGQSFVVENRTGAAGMVGTASVARASPDGHTILTSAAGEIVINPHLFAKMSYKPLEDLMPVTQLVRLPFLLVAHPSVGVRTVQELIEKARREPDKLNYASGGMGSVQHLAAEMLRSAAGGLKMAHVPYRGVAPALGDLIAGHVSILFAGFPSAIEHVRKGTLVSLGVTSSARVDSDPGIPTIAEQGLAGFEITQWFGTFLPASTPKDVHARVHGEITAILALPEVRQNLIAQGAIPVGSTSDDFAAFIRAETDKYAKIVREAGVKVDQQ